MTVYFLHGRKYGPQDPKILKLISVAKSHNLYTCNVGLIHISSPDERVELLKQLIKDEKEDEYILVGSSMGGYVSLLAAEYIKPKALFLLAPAFYIKGYEQQNLPYPKIDHYEIVHGINDTVVPIANSIRYIEGMDSQLQLHQLDTDHAFTNAIDDIAVLFDEFLKGIK